MNTLNKYKLLFTILVCVCSIFNKTYSQAPPLINCSTTPITPWPSGTFGSLNAISYPSCGPLYLKDFNVINIVKCPTSDVGYTNSVSENNTLGLDQNSDFFNQTNNIINPFNPENPLGKVRRINLTNGISQYFIPNTTTSINNSFISIYNSTQTQDDNVLFSGTHYDTILHNGINNDNKESEGILGVTDYNSNTYDLIRFKLTNALRIINRNPTGTLAVYNYVNIIDAVRDNAGNYYVVGTIATKLNTTSGINFFIQLDNNYNVIYHRIMAHNSQFAYGSFERVVYDPSNESVWMVGQNSWKGLIGRFDINNQTLVVKRFSPNIPGEEARFFDIKKDPITQNYIVGFMENHYHLVGYLVFDNSLKLLSEYYWSLSGNYIPGYTNFSPTSATATTLGLPFSASPTAQFNQYMLGTKYQSIHVEDNRIYFYGTGYHGNVYAFVELYQQFNLYQLSLGEHYTHSPGTITDLWQAINTTNPNFQDHNGSSPIFSKLMHRINGSLYMYKSGEDNINTPLTCPQMTTTPAQWGNAWIDKIISTADYINNPSLVQICNTTATNTMPNTGSSVFHNPCAYTFPVDNYRGFNNFFHLTYDYDLDFSYTCFGCNLNTDILLSGQNPIEVDLNNSINLITEELQNCTIGNNLTANVYLQDKSISQNGKEDKPNSNLNTAKEVIKSFTISNIIGQEIKLESLHLKDMNYSENILKMIQNELKIKGLYLIKITTDQRDIMTKITIE